MKIKKASPGLDQRNRLGVRSRRGLRRRGLRCCAPARRAGCRCGRAAGARHSDHARSDRCGATGLKLIQRPGDHLPRAIDLAACAKRRAFPCRVFRRKVQGSPARDVAEHAFYLLLALAKQQWLARASVKARKAGLPKTMSVHGKTLGLVGLGNTGEALARLAVPFGLRVVAVKRSRRRRARTRTGARRGSARWIGLPELLAESDFVSLHLPQTPETVDFIGRDELSRMKQRRVPDQHLARADAEPTRRCGGAAVGASGRRGSRCLVAGTRRSG